MPTTLTMQMTGSGGGALSVPGEHLPGLVALLAVVLAVSLGGWLAKVLASHDVGWAQTLTRRYESLPFAAKAAALGASVGAAVHAAIVPTHWADERVTAVLFVVDTVGFGVALWWTVAGRRHWRWVAATMLAGTAAGYALYLLTGWETVDLVGLATTTVELAAAIVVVATMPRSLRTSRSRQRWVAVAAVPTALSALLGTSALAGATAAASGAVAPAPLALTTTSPAGPLVWPDDMADMAPGMKMAEPNCHAQPTVGQQRAAVDLVDQTVAAVAPYRSLAAARAAGYVPVTPTGRRVVHYINPSTYRRGGNPLDPVAVPALVYVNTGHGAVLSAAMYLMSPRDGTDKPPQPGGCLTQWHIHTDLCFSAGHVVGNDAAGACASGTNHTTEPMMHVWVVAVPGGPLAPDPPATSEVRAASQAPTPDPPNGTA